MKYWLIVKKDDNTLWDGVTFSKFSGNTKIFEGLQDAYHEVQYIEPKISNYFGFLTCTEENIEEMIKESGIASNFYFSRLLRKRAENSSKYVTLEQEKRLKDLGFVNGTWDGMRWRSCTNDSEITLVTARKWLRYVRNISGSEGLPLDDFLTIIEKYQ